ncbi:hypothetical protein V8C42DRAFT_158981 [Trichoderma barbatum]
MSSIPEPASAPAPASLPLLRRVITTHNADGKSIISESLSQTIPRFEIPGMHFHLGYTLSQTPGVLDNDQDLKEYEDLLPHNMGISIPSGAVLRVVDVLPGQSVGLMHRTATVDFGVVMEGELELIMDSGESTVLKRGDIIIQRGTNHAWKNNSATETARGFFVLVGAVLPTVNGTQLTEEVPLEALKTE